MTDIDPIRRRHNDFVSSHPCSTDTCDTRIVLDALDESKADTLRMGQNWEDALTQRDAARVHADRLAEALDRAVIVLEMMQTGYRLDARDAAALVGRADEGRRALRHHQGREGGRA